MKVFKFDWQSGWQWECDKLQRLANWIDKEANGIFNCRSGRNP